MTLARIFEDDAVAEPALQKGRVVTAGSSLLRVPWAGPRLWVVVPIHEAGARAAKPAGPELREPF